MNESNIFGKEVMLWHGSKSGINLPILPKSREQCDFGCGFYLGDKQDQPKGLIAKYDKAVLYKCSLDLAGLRVKRFGSRREDLLEWAMYVAGNRGFSSYSVQEDYDVVIGLIADDAMMQVMNEFFDNNITDKVFIDALKCVNFGNQYVCKTGLACSHVSILEQRKLSDKERKLELAIAGNRMRDMTATLNSIKARYRRDNSALYYDEILEMTNYGKA